MRNPESLKKNRAKANQLKADQLGMPYGTANGRLRKSIIFHLIQQLGQDVCYRCEQKIESEDSLSIEHKKAWLEVDVALFWDVNNIAFSHLSCNVGAGRRQGAMRSPPEGQEWCFGCKQFHPTSAFAPAMKRPGHRRLLRGHCNEFRRRNGWEHHARSAKSNNSSDV